MVHGHPHMGDSGDSAGGDHSTAKTSGGSAVIFAPQASKNPAPICNDIYDIKRTSMQVQSC